MYRFIGEKGKYQRPKDSIVKLVKCYAKRKCIIEYDEKISFKRGVIAEAK